MSYISTVISPGYARYMVRLGGVMICVIDVPSGQGAYVTGLARRWLLGEDLPESVTVWSPA